jgi:hypothetical protein
MQRQCGGTVAEPWTGDQRTVSLPLEIRLGEETVHLGRAINCLGAHPKARKTYHVCVRACTVAQGEAAQRPSHIPGPHREYELCAVQHCAGIPK